MKCVGWVGANMNRPIRQGFENDGRRSASNGNPGVKRMQGQGCRERECHGRAGWEPMTMLKAVDSRAS